MDLRVSLLIIGGLIVLAIYLASQRHIPSEERHASMTRKKYGFRLWQALRQRFRALSHTERNEGYTPVAPVLESHDLDQLEEIIPDRSGDGITTEEMPVILELGSEQIAPAGEQLFIPLTLMARTGQVIDGATIDQATQTLGMILKQDGLYRFEVKDAQGYQQPLLGLANILEPGTFSTDHLDQLTTPGLVLYLHLPAPIEARDAFEKLIEIGYQLEELLEAELCDETRSALTKQSIGHLKEKVEAFRFKQKMTSLQRRRT